MQYRPSNPAAFEWFEWLYDRLEQFPSAPGGRPAHVAFRDWRP
jgi:hypothetical protein